MTFNNRLLRAVDRFLTRNQLVKLVTVSPEMVQPAAAYFRVAGERISCIANGVDLNQFQFQRRATSAAPTIAMVGTISLHKGQEHGLNAFRLLQETFPEAKLLIVGDGPDRSRLESLVKGQSALRGIRFLGTRSDVPQILSEADFLWLLSAGEGMPLVALEAMAVGVPVVGFNVSGVRDVVLHGETGALVSYGDAQGVAAATVELASDVINYERLSGNCRKHTETHHSFETVVQRHEAALLKAQAAKR